MTLTKSRPHAGHSRDRLSPSRIDSSAGRLKHIRPYLLENTGSRPLSHSQAGKGQISSWVGDDQRIPAVVCFVFLQNLPRNVNIVLFLSLVVWHMYRRWLVSWLGEEAVHIRYTLDTWGRYSCCRGSPYEEPIS
jgi:hypothetical protein